VNLGKRLIRTLAALGVAFAAVTSAALAQSQSGFTYNGLNLTSYQTNEYLNSASAAATMRQTGANYGAVMVTQYQQTSTSNVIAPELTSSAGYTNSDPTSPSDAAVVTAIKNMQAQGLVVSMKPQVDSLDGVFRGNFAPTNPTAWFQSYQTFILHYAQIASQNGVGLLVIGTELKSLSGSAYKSNWETIITALRTQYPDLTLAYGANATGAGDEFTTVSFWADVDIIGVDGYFPLTNQTDPSLSALVSAWTGNKNGFNAVAALKNLQSTYNKPLIFTEIGYVSVAGTNEQPYASLNGAYDPTEQQNCYEAFFEVFSQQTAWMKGVFWWEWTVSAPGANDINYPPQNKPAGTVTLPKWYGNTTPGFTIAPAQSTMALGQGLSATDVISVSAQGGFAGSVTLAASGLPAGVTASFSAGLAAGTQVLTLTASSSVAISGPVTVTLTGTSGAVTASNAISLAIVAPTAQTISFTNPGAQTAGTAVALVASSTSGLPITFSSTTAAICTVMNANVTLLAPGTCSITASQSGTSTYAAATPVTDSFNVTAPTTVPVPASSEVVVSQVNWRTLIGGYSFASGNPAGSSDGVNTNGSVVIANSNGVVLINELTGVTTTLGAWSSASGLAVDAGNNIYVGNPYGPVNAIIKVPYVGGSANGGYAAFTTPTASTPVCAAGGMVECMLGSNLGAVNIASMTFDVGGDLFYATASNGSMGGNSIYECNTACIAGTGAPVLVYAEPTAATAPSATSGQLLVGGLSVDTAGNLFFTDSSVYVSPSYAYTSFSSNLKELTPSTGAGFGGQATGYSAAPDVLYTITPASPSAYGDQIDAVNVLRGTSGDTVYFSAQNDGVFAFPDTAGGIPLANGQPTALYAVSTQGAKTLTSDAQGNLYLVNYSSATGGSGGDTLAQVTLGNVMVPVSATGTATSPSTTTGPVTTLLNDVSCSGSPAISFAATPSANATATVSTSGNCNSTFTGGSSFATTVSFTPVVAGPDSVVLQGTDQSGNTTSVSVNGTGSGFTVAASSSSLTLAQGASMTDTITVANQGGFTGSATLAATGLPAGVTATFDTNPTSGTSVLTLAASATATVAGPVNVTITGVSGASMASTVIALTITPPPSFTINPASTSVSVTQGSSATDVLTVTAGAQMPGAVTFSVSGLPAGVTGSFSPNPTSGGSSTLTLTASSTAAIAGPVNVTITGTSASNAQTTSVAVTVAAAPGFSLAAVAASVTVAQGASASSTINITDTGGFTGSVTLSATGLPAGVTAAFATNPATTSSIVTFTASSTATTGMYTVTINGVSGSVTSSTTVTMTVSLPPTFTLASSSASISVAQSGNATNTITINGTSGFNGPVMLSASGLPAGVTAVFATNPATASSVVTFTAATSAAAGMSTVTINGVSGTLMASTAVALTVTPGPSFTITPASASITLVQGTSVNDGITLSGTNGFTGAVTLAVAGLPSGVTATFSTNPVTSMSTLTLAASTTATIGGPVTITISGVSGTVTGSAPIMLTVNVPPSFTLNAAPATLSIPQTTSATSTVTLVSIGGFSGTPTLAASGLPAGVTATFAAGSVAGTQIVTFTATSAAVVASPTPATTTVTITGTSGTLQASTVVAITIVSAPSVTIVGPDITVKRGAGILNTSTLTITPTNGFAGTVALTCAITPTATSNQPTCSLAPASVTLTASASQTAVLTVNTTAGALVENHAPPVLWRVSSGIAFAFLLFLGVPRKRRLLSGLLLTLLAAVLLGVTGCGSSPNYSNQSNGTSPGSYVVTVTGTAGATTVTGTVNLIVQ
jgi:uncharacterized membrane protein